MNKQLLILWVGIMSATITKAKLSPLLHENPFTYDLGVKIIPSKKDTAGVMICCHGYGHSNDLVNALRTYPISDHLVGFNFPDYGITDAIDHTKSKFGTIDELLPLLYMLKRCVIDLKLSAIKLYGFSAGGGAVVNALAVLNESTYDKQLQSIN